MMYQPLWIVTVDSRCAALLSCKVLATGGLQLDQVQVLKNTHENEHPHHRPALLGGAERRVGCTHSSACAAPHAASCGHEAEEERLRFAREIRDWLMAARRDLDVRDVILMASPRMLGLLRTYLQDVNMVIMFRKGGLKHLTPQEVAAHPSMLAATAHHALV